MKLTTTIQNLIVTINDIQYNATNIIERGGYYNMIKKANIIIKNIDKSEFLFFKEWMNSEKIDYKKDIPFVLNSGGEVLTGVLKGAWCLSSKENIDDGSGDVELTYGAKE